MTLPNSSCTIKGKTQRGEKILPAKWTISNTSQWVTLSKRHALKLHLCLTPNNMLKGGIPFSFWNHRKEWEEILGHWLDAKPYQIKCEFSPRASFCLSTHFDWFAVARTHTKNGRCRTSGGLPCQHDWSLGEWEQISGQLEQMYSFTLVYSN